MSFMYQSFLERLGSRLHWEAICIMPPQWRQTEASYADIASQNPPQAHSKLLRREKSKFYCLVILSEFCVLVCPPLTTQTQEDQTNLVDDYVLSQVMLVSCVFQLVIHSKPDVLWSQKYDFNFRHMDTLYVSIFLYHFF